jgi:poly-gamma-glutamate synthesis protein (capsule biosynthesis protein)
MVTLFLCGDVMTGRGVDQIMAHPSDPVIYESYMRSADGYVKLAERVSGPIPDRVGGAYIWGDALMVLSRLAPDLRLINLETSVTTSAHHWPKGINYRMHPDNVHCLSAAAIDGCVLANNHVLDWGHAGLVETLAVLEAAGIRSVGAGRDRRRAAAPAIFEIPAKGRVVLFAYGDRSSGIPASWSASEQTPGVNLLPDLSSKTVGTIKKQVAAVKQEGDIVVVSLHWGGNWGYDVPAAQRTFAHRLIDTAGVDAIFGHSSHHFKAVEVYRHKPILYGCGDFLNDYEGIRGHEHYRSHLTLMFLPGFDPHSGRLLQMLLVPMQIKRFQTIRTSPRDSQWILNRLNREGRRFGTRVAADPDGIFHLIWE